MTQPFLNHNDKAQKTSQDTEKTRQREGQMTRHRRQRQWQGTEDKINRGQGTEDHVGKTRQGRQGFTCMSCLLVCFACFVLLAAPCLALPCLALPSIALPCLALPCLALLWLAVSCLPCMRAYLPCVLLCGCAGCVFRVLCFIFKWLLKSLLINIQRLCSLCSVHACILW